MMAIFAKFFTSAIPICIHQQAVVNEMLVTNLLFKLARPILSDALIEKLAFYGTDFTRVQQELGGEQFAPDFVGGSAVPVPWPDRAACAKYLRRALPIMDSQ